LTKERPMIPYFVPDFYKDFMVIFYFRLAQ
jgi:hypothetical protein